MPVGRCAAPATRPSRAAAPAVAGAGGCLLVHLLLPADLEGSVGLLVAGPAPLREGGRRGWRLPRGFRLGPARWVGAAGAAHAQVRALSDRGLVRLLRLP